MADKAYTAGYGTIPNSDQQTEAIGRTAETPFAEPLPPCRSLADLMRARTTIARAAYDA
jgi:hypothetical protein